MGEVKVKNCEFEPCGQEFEANRQNTGLFQAYCPGCVKHRVWFRGHHATNRIKEINAEKEN